MKKNKGFQLINVLVSMGILLLISSLGFVTWRNYKENFELKQAKIEIYELFSTYSLRSLNTYQKYYIDLNFLEKKIKVYSNSRDIVEILKLPKKLNYTIVIKGKKQDFYSAHITENGNISPSFSLYIFGYDNIARYRISFYGFDIIKYMKINIYKNLNDKHVTLQTINDFHNSWTTANTNWKEE